MSARDAPPRLWSWSWATIGAAFAGATRFRDATPGEPMPTPEARAAFHDAQQLMNVLRQLHDQEATLSTSIEAALSEPDRQHLQSELLDLRKQWDETFQNYSAAIVRYTDALKASRSG